MGDDGKSLALEATYPVDLVEVVRLQNEAGHDTRARSNLHLNLDRAEEEVPIRGDGRSIASLGDREHSTLRFIVIQRGGVGNLEVIAGTLGEVDGQGRRECIVVRAGCDTSEMDLSHPPIKKAP